MTIINIVEEYLKTLVGGSIRVYGYKHPKIPRRYYFEECPKQMYGGWEYIGEIDVIITKYYIDVDRLVDSDGEFESDDINCSIYFLHDDIERWIYISVK